MKMRSIAMADCVQFWMAYLMLTVCQVCVCAHVPVLCISHCFTSECPSVAAIIVLAYMLRDFRTTPNHEKLIYPNPVSIACGTSMTAK